jgi:hypothetical protein
VYLLNAYILGILIVEMIVEVVLTVTETLESPVVIEAVTGEGRGLGIETGANYPNFQYVM